MKTNRFQDMDLLSLEMEFIDGDVNGSDSESGLDHFKLDALLRAIPGALGIYEESLRNFLIETTETAAERKERLGV